MSQHCFKFRIPQSKYIALGLLSFIGTLTYAQNSIQYTIDADVQAGCGQFAPFYFTSNQHGVVSAEKNSGYLSAALHKGVDKKKRFDFGFGADIIGSYNNSSSFWIQLLYGEVKYRCLNLMIGSKEIDGVFKNSILSSGGLVWSGNARPIPQVRAGIFEFVAIPGTNGWVQIKGDIAYGLFLDNKWLENNFGYENYFITTGAWYHQKKIFFRSKEDKNFVATIGGELATQFGGKQRNYINGTLESTYKDKVKLKDLFCVLLPQGGGESANPGDQAYYYGNHLGSWHGIFEYKLKNHQKVTAYFEWLFDDASGMGKLNGWDGLWGIEYATNRPSVVSNIVFEYLQTTNQGGPIHWAPNDFPDTSVKPEATGADNYYNNFFYNGWAHYGMANGSPLLKSPIYNEDGYIGFTDNRVQAFHLALAGNFCPEVFYVFKNSYRRGWGTYFAPFKEVAKSYSLLLDITYKPKQLQSWAFSGKVGLDRGNHYSLGNNLGFGIKITKTGTIYTFK